MSSADEEESQLRQRLIETDEKEIEAVEIENNESSLKLQQDFNDEKSKLSDSEHEDEKEPDFSETTEEIIKRSTGSVRVLPRNLQPIQRPSFIVRQFRSVKNFFIELFEFILLL